jgi:hypothetical protein
MTAQKSRRKSLTLANTRWATYALAGAATSLTGVASAEAEIHYSGRIDHRFTGHTGATFPLDNGAHLAFSRQSRGSSHRGFAHLAILGSGGPQDSEGYFAGKPNNPTSGFGFYVFRLASQVPISRGNMGRSCFTTSSSSIKECFGATIQSWPGSYGSFTAPGRGFIGFSFHTGGGNQFGWARIKTTGVPLNNFILVDYAWADLGESIVTGQKTSHDTTKAVTKSGSLGLLATGGEGLKAWRQQRQEIPFSAVPEQK